MVTPTEFFEPWEPPDPVSSLTEFLEIVEKAFARWTNTANANVYYAWRGVVNAGFPLHSSLYRRMRWSNPNRTTEPDLAALEGALLSRAHRWGLHYSDHAHMPILYELATMQHFGTPTRLLDVTFNPLVALWFAVEDQRDEHGQLLHDDKDGRLFVFDVSSRIINDGSRVERMWEESFSRPWTGDEVPADWKTRAWAWRPAPIEARFAAQNGGFIFGGVPATGAGSWRRGPLLGWVHGR